MYVRDKVFWIVVLHAEVFKFITGTAQWFGLVFFYCTPGFFWTFVLCARSNSFLVGPMCSMFPVSPTKLSVGPALATLMMQTLSVLTAMIRLWLWKVGDTSRAIFGSSIAIGVSLLDHILKQHCRDARSWLFMGGMMLVFEMQTLLMTQLLKGFTGVK